MGEAASLGGTRLLSFLGLLDLSVSSFCLPLHPSLSPPPTLLLSSPLPPSLPQCLLPVFLAGYYSCSVISPPLLLLSLSYFIFFLATPRSLQDLSSSTRDRTQAPGSESAKSNHWTAREFPLSYFIFFD